jgi:hypothetical protein
MVKKIIDFRYLVLTEVLILMSYFYSVSIFKNIQVAFLSSFFVIIGSSFAYRKMIKSQLNVETFEDKRDLLDSIEDPHELYDENEINLAPAEELDLREIVKEEKAKIKTFSFKSIKHGAKGSVSLYRLVPYLFLVLGFIALENNKILDLRFYLPSLLAGIIIGSLLSKKLA